MKAFLLADPAACCPLLDTSLFKDVRRVLVIASQKEASLESSIQALLSSLSISPSSIAYLTAENAGKAGRLVRESDLVVLPDGNQKAELPFLHSFPLSMLLKNYKGFFLSYGKGSFNASEKVLADGEIVKGLGLTKVKFALDIAVQSPEVLFFFAPESYLYKDGEVEDIHGECWTVIKGKVHKISEKGELVRVHD